MNEDEYQALIDQAQEQTLALIESYRKIAHELKPTVVSEDNEFADALNEAITLLEEIAPELTY